MLVEIWSDVMCPFCYLGKKNFEKALSQVSFCEEVKVMWRSFQLDPRLPREGLQVTTAEYLAQSKGWPQHQIEKMISQIQQAGLKAGIDFRQDISIPANTFDAQRLVHIAQANGKGSAMEEALFEAHFTHGKNIGNWEILTNIADQLGLDSNQAMSILESEAYIDEVKKDLSEARQLGVQGVPYFILNRKYAVTGAQPVEIFRQALEQTFSETQNIPQFAKSQDADSCSETGCKTGF